MMDLLTYVDAVVVIFALAGAYWKLNGKLDDIKKETEENRQRSLAAQDVVKSNTEAINELKIILAEIKILLQERGR